MLDIDTNGSVRTVTIDRPEARNALSVDGPEALEAAIDDADEPVIYLRGRGPAFSAGADLNRSPHSREIATARPISRAWASASRERSRTLRSRRRRNRQARTRRRPRTSRLACDVRVGTPESTYGEPGVSFGLFGAWGRTVRLPRVLGEGDALEFAPEDGRSTPRKRYGSDSFRASMTILDRSPKRSRQTTDALVALKRRIRDDGERATQERREAAAFADLVAAHADDIDALLE